MHQMKGDWLCGEFTGDQCKYQRDQADYISKMTVSRNRFVQECIFLGSQPKKYENEWLPRKALERIFDLEKYIGPAITMIIKKWLWDSSDRYIWQMMINTMFTPHEPPHSALIPQNPQNLCEIFGSGKPHLLQRLHEGKLIQLPVQYLLRRSAPASIPQYADCQWSTTNFDWFP